MMQKEEVNVCPHPGSFFGSTMDSTGSGYRQMLGSIERKIEKKESQL